MHRDPPAGYNRCTVTQIVAAGKAVRQKLLEDNIKPRRQADGILPLDEALQKALESYEVSFCLLPLQSKKEPKKKGDKKKDETEVIKKVKGDKVKPGKGKGKSRILQKLSWSWGVYPKIQVEKTCALHTSLVAARTQLIGRSAAVAFMFARNASACIPSSITRAIDYPLMKRDLQEIVMIRAS